MQTSEYADIPKPPFRCAFPPYSISVVEKIGSGNTLRGCAILRVYGTATVQLDRISYLRQDLAFSDYERVQTRADLEQVPHRILPREHEKVLPQLRLREARVLLEVGHHVSDRRVRVVGGNVHLEAVAGGQHRGLLDVRELAKLRAQKRQRNKATTATTAKGGAGGQGRGGLLHTCQVPGIEYEVYTYI